jgi:uncharacterized protein with von Willebrand factor type A (vWA) domain
VEDLPLIDLFYYLREEEFALGVGEFLLLQRALQAGFGQDRPALLRLAKRLWAKSKAQERVIEEYFVQREVQVKTADPQAAAEAVSEWEPDGLSRDILPETQNPEELAARRALDERAASQIPGRAGSQDGSPTPHPTAGVEERRGTSPVRPVVQVTIRKANLPERVSRAQYALTGEYQPVSQRQMKQGWRYLRRMKRSGVPVELDLPATVQKAGMEGLLYEPVLVPVRTNQAQLLLLVDRGGSMVPFHALGADLAHTAAASGRLGRFGAYFFTNLPIPSQAPTADPEGVPSDYTCYRSPGLAFEESLAHILAKFNLSETSILVFSDAGAARRRWNLERVVATARLIAFLQRRKPLALVWLNPIPADRWKPAGPGSKPAHSAQAIASFTHMFPVDRQGLAAVIDALRGFGK